MREQSCRAFLLPGKRGAACQRNQTPLLLPRLSKPHGRGSTVRNMKLLPGNGTTSTDAPADSNKKYGRAWKRIRDRYAAAHPLCELCLKEGRLTPVEEVHHIVPLSQGGTHRNDNLMSLCQSCHTKLHHELGRPVTVGAVKISGTCMSGQRPGASCAKKAKSKG